MTTKVTAAELAAQKEYARKVRELNCARSSRRWRMSTASAASRM